MLVKGCTQYTSKFGELNQWPQNWKRSVFIPVPKKGNAKECSNCHIIALISHASKVMLKILQARLQQYVNCELPDVQAGFRKGRGTRDQIANILWIMGKNKRVPEKHLLLLYRLCQSLWLCGKEYVKAIYWNHAYLTYMQKTSWETLGRKKHELESRLPGEIPITSDMQMTLPLRQKVKRKWRVSWLKWKRRVKDRLETQQSKN